MRYAIINKDTNEIENIIIWDGVTDFGLPENMYTEIATEIHEEKWRMKFEAASIILGSVQNT